MDDCFYSGFSQWSTIIFLFVFLLSSGQQLGEKCVLPQGKTGICSEFVQCHEIIIPQHSPDKLCSYVGDMPIICCANPKIDTSREVQTPNEKQCIRRLCGHPTNLPTYRVVLEDDTDHEIYYLNRTADILESQGFTVTVDEMHLDTIKRFNYTNGTFSGQKQAKYFYGVSPTGGRPALKQRGYFMALLGERRNGDTQWLCDGILINDYWVLSAAHCFYSPTHNINAIRLGEYDWRDTSESNVFDHTIEKLVVHYLYEPASGYHDLVLIKLSKKVGTMHSHISPICLPWGVESNRKHIGSILTLSGWGATSFHAAGGSKTNVLTEVDLKVFNTSRCDVSYATLLDYPQKWSHGMNENNILCAGSDEGGKDACKGDSGAPLVYVREDGKMVLAAVVSAGFGCGLKDFPGLYIPINPFYLQWIKDVAFDECSKMDPKQIVFPT